MNQWSFVAAAYGVSIVSTIGLLFWAYLSMRRAEATVDELRRQ